MKNYSRSISVCLMKTGLFLSLLLLVFLAACAPGDAADEPTVVPEAAPIIDQAAEPTAVLEATSVTDEASDLETDLLVNPEVVPDGEFVVQGTITSASLIPQDEPLIKIMTENGQIFQIRCQPVPQITYEDGTVVPPLEIKNGQQIRATVVQGEAGGLGGDPVLVSSNLTILDTD